MTKVSVVNYPRIGEQRELKRAIESYLKKEISQETLQEESKKLREKHWKTQQEQGVNHISSNDFSFYDNVLDLSFLLGAVPKRYTDLGLNHVDTYFAMAKGYQSENADVKALPMKKWLNTNYHYVVPEIEEGMTFQLHADKLFSEYKEALALGIETKVSVVGPFTFLKLANVKIDKKDYRDFINEVTGVYCELLKEANKEGVALLQVEEPSFVMELSPEEVGYVKEIYGALLSEKGNVKVLLQTYFGDVRDVYQELIALDFDGIGLDFVEGKKTLELVEKYGFPQDKTLFAGVVNGKNIWKNDYSKPLQLVEKLKEYSVVISTSCSLLHVPYTLRNEKKLGTDYRKHLAFAQEKLQELVELGQLAEIKDYAADERFVSNQETIQGKGHYSQGVRDLYNEVKDLDFAREVSYEERSIIQNKLLNLPVLPTTTIGSFPQTADVRKIRKAYKDGSLSLEQYKDKMKELIKECVEVQEEMGLDVLVHGEFERNDMVEYFGQNLDGFIFTENAWVQSYGTRGLKPPIIFGDVSRPAAFTVEWSVYAQSLSEKVVKGMLTGPVTILNWSYPREDISLKEMAYQIALAMKEEVLDLEKNGINVIQIDEAALREKLPLRKEDWHTEYLDWAIQSFKLVTQDVKPETQIHTHMCYSDFEDIMAEISAMDADVITIETAKTELEMLDTLKDNEYNKGVGPGVYDVHSPRVPSVEEFTSIINSAIEKIGTDKLWINPDCGLKTRGNKETMESLKRMVEATKLVRANI